MKKALLLTVLTVAVLAMVAVPAFAEGYNDGGYNYTTKGDTGEYAGNAGIYVRNPEGAFQEQSFQGPHGGYNTTTNKCQDCHSTHYATGSYMLLRANSREDACTFCHAGGGGSSINIQMDNAYDIDGVIGSDTNYASGKTGHTLGYTGKAPADIEPAFQDTAGLACFSCHTPHGNSARVLEAFGSPARPAGDGYVDDIVGVSFMATQMFRIQEQLGVVFDWNDFNGFTGQAYPEGSYMPIPEDLTQLPHDMDGAAISKWTGAATKVYDIVPASPTIQAELGALETSFNNWAGNGMSPSAPEPADMMAWRMDPANFTGDMNGYAMVNDTGVGNLFALFGVTGPDPGNPLHGWQLVNLFMDWKVYWGADLKVGNINTFFLNMGDWQIDGSNYTMQGMPQIETWVKPLFPKGRFLLLKNPDTGDDYSMGDGGVNEFGMPSPDFKTAAVGETASAEFGNKVAIDWEWPLGPAATWGPFFYTDSNERFPLAFPWAPKGVAMENEMCTSCHDGAAGLSSQPAKVWLGDDAGTYGLDPEDRYIVAYSHDSNNRGCARAQYLNPEDENNFGPHCANCHTGSGGCYTCHDDLEATNWNGGSAYDADSVLHEGSSTYQAPPAVRASAAVNVNGQCIDGGFSYPHRTLGANMLKDQLYGVDFDGTPVAAGEPRSIMASVTVDFGTGYFDESFQASSIAGQNAHNLDSVCIDCHGNATYWNGDDSTYYADFVSVNPLTYGWTTPQSWEIKGWDLLLKGLP